MASSPKLVRMSGEFTRPNNTTAYAAQQVVADSTSAATVLTLFETEAQGNVIQGLEIGASYKIKTVHIIKNNNTTTGTAFDVYFYSSGITVQNDAADFILKYTEKNIRIGKTTFGSSGLISEDGLYTGGSSSTCCEAVNVNVDLCFKANTQTLSAQIITLGSYTPEANEKFYVECLLEKIN